MRSRTNPPERFNPLTRMCVFETDQAGGATQKPLSFNPLTRMCVFETILVNQTGRFIAFQSPYEDVCL